MANWYGSARSNYFHVKDVEAFKEWVDTLSGCGVINDDEGRWGLLVNSENGGWPSNRYDEETDGYVDIDLAKELVEHLAEGQVAVLMECGAEKLRFITGFATAVSWTGETVQISLDDIYQKAQEAFGVEPSQAAY